MRLTLNELGTGWKINVFRDSSLFFYFSVSAKSNQHSQQIILAGWVHFPQTSRLHDSQTSLVLFPLHLATWHIFLFVGGEGVSIRSRLRATDAAPDDTVLAILWGAHSCFTSSRINIFLVMLTSMHCFSTECVHWLQTGLGCCRTQLQANAWSLPLLNTSVPSGP